MKVQNKLKDAQKKFLRQNWHCDLSPNVRLECISFVGQARLYFEIVLLFEDFA
jgi:hypothetical protein